jgi:tellurite resistance protein
MTPTPIVLIEIDADSRLVIRQTSGVRVAFIDQRVDGDHVSIFSERDQMDAIIAACATKKILSPQTDDEVRTAANAIRRVVTGDVIV